MNALTIAFPHSCNANTKAARLITPAQSNIHPKINKIMIAKIDIKFS